MTSETVASPLPEILELDMRDVLDSLSRGLSDFLAAPAFGLFFGGVFVAGGWLIAWAVSTQGQIWWTLPAAAGFPILGPFIACGLYDVSRRREAGDPLDWPGVLGVILRQRDRQIAFVAAIVVVFFLFWNFVAHALFALFLGLMPMTNVMSGYDIFLTQEGLTMLAVGTLVGAVFAGVMFMLTAVSLPMLLEREVDAVTAMITSTTVVTTSPKTMGVWGAIIAVLLFVGMLPWFLGLFVVLPVLGHATWHLYRRALHWPEVPPEAKDKGAPPYDSAPAVR
jgi:uncharacterized membrane protein